MTRQLRPSPPGVEVGVTEAMIRSLVIRFYAQVRHDDLLGPIFNRTITDWDTHLDKLCDFWSSITLMTGRFKGTPMQAHAGLPDITGQHFDRWLALFRDTATAVCPPEAAALFVDRSQRIAQSLAFGMARHREATMCRRAAAASPEQRAVSTAD